MAIETKSSQDQRIEILWRLGDEYIVQEINDGGKAISHPWAMSMKDVPSGTEFRYDYYES